MYVCTYLPCLIYQVNIKEILKHSPEIKKIINKNNIIDKKNTQIIIIKNKTNKIIQKLIK